MTTIGLTPPLKWHGGKHYLASRIVKLMPPHVHYVEPYAGGLAVMLAKDPQGVSEVANDVNSNLTNFWRVLSSVELFSAFLRRVQAIPFSEAEWAASHKAADSDADPVARAVAFFVLCRQSLAGRMESFAPLSRTRTRRGMNEQASAWLNAVDGLPAVHKRLSRVVVLNRPALDVIRTQDGESTLFYCDPPYLHQTRAALDVYHHEMSEADHVEMLGVLAACKGRVMLSGYRSVLYDRALDGWNRHDFDLANHAAGGDSKRRMVECIWCNF